LAATVIVAGGSGAKIIGYAQAPEKNKNYQWQSHSPRRRKVGGFWKETGFRGDDDWRASSGLQLGIAIG
jgi:hypothetical protein